MIWKILLWVPYGFTLLFLGAYVYWLSLHFGLCFSEVCQIAWATCLYGALLVASSDIHRMGERRRNA